MWGDRGARAEGPEKQREGPGRTREWKLLEVDGVRPPGPSKLDSVNKAASALADVSVGGSTSGRPDHVRAAAAATAGDEQRAPSARYPGWHCVTHSKEQPPAPAGSTEYRSTSGELCSSRATRSGNAIGFPRCGWATAHGIGQRVSSVGDTSDPPQSNSTLLAVHRPV